jgi:hypothetical protein
MVTLEEQVKQLQMLRAAQIKINRGEGPIHECGERVFTGTACWEMAELHLFVSSGTAPREGGYDKCDVEITWGDGAEVYTTRYDMVHRMCENFETLEQHVRRAWRFYSGEHCPRHMTQERYERFLVEFKVPCEAYKKLIATCALGDEQRRAGAVL